MRLTHIGRLPVAAASGLVVAGGVAYAVADDEWDLLVFDPAAPGQARKRLAGRRALPGDPAARKRVKGDLEALVELPDGALLALGSGSTSTRSTGLLWRADGVEPVELTALHEALASEVPDLNLEGATVCEGELLLFQRGNGAAGINAVGRLDLAVVGEEIAAGELTARGLRAVERHELPAGLGFTDATTLPDGRVVVSAVGEGGASTYLDGPLTAAAVGVLGQELHGVEPQVKIEGIALGPAGLLVVCDPDDAGTSASVWHTAVP